RGLTLRYTRAYGAGTACSQRRDRYPGSCHEQVQHPVGHQAPKGYGIAVRVRADKRTADSELGYHDRMGTHRHCIVEITAADDVVDTQYIFAPVVLRFPYAQAGSRFREDMVLQFHVVFGKPAAEILRFFDSDLIGTLHVVA